MDELHSDLNELIPAIRKAVEERKTVLFSEKSFNFRLILTVIYILSVILTPFTLLYFTKEISMKRNRIVS